MVEEIESRYLAQLAAGDYDGCDKLRFKLINLLGDLLVKDPAAAIDNDLQTKWWRLGYYKPIEHYRKALRTDAGKLASARLLQLTDEGSGTVLGIVRVLAEHYELPSVPGLFQALGLPSPTSTSRQRITNPAAPRLLAHLLICAGDLARYKCGASSLFLTHDQFSLARLFYSHAAVVQPGFGHAYNMLAVISSLQESPLETVYWYMRSICCAEPAVMGRENLKTYLRSGYCQRQAKHWDPESFINLLQSHLFDAQVMSPGLFDYTGVTPTDKLYIALILIGLDHIKPLNLSIWFPQVSHELDSAQEQLIALLAMGFGVTSSFLPAIPVHRDLKELVNELHGYSPLSRFVTDLQRNIHAFALDKLLLDAGEEDPEEDDEELILFKGFQK